MNKLKKPIAYLTAIILSFTLILPVFAEDSSVIPGIAVRDDACQVWINMSFTEISEEITPELFGISDIEITEIVKVKGHNDQGISVLTGYAVTIEVDSPDRLTKVMAEIRKLDFVDDVKRIYLPSSGEIEIDISNVKEENQIKSLWGDANFDNAVTAADARTVLRIAAQLENNSNEMLDINNDGKITASDARAILRASAQIAPLEVSYKISTDTEYLIGPIETFPEFGKWKTAAISENMTIQEDYGTDNSAPGNATAYYLLFSAEKPGEYALTLKNDRQSTEIIINLIAK